MTTINKRRAAKHENMVQDACAIVLHPVTFPNYKLRNLQLLNVSGESITRWVRGIKN